MNTPVVVRNTQRTPAEIVLSLASYGVSTIHEAQDRTGLMHSYMRPIYSGAAATGTAVTVSLPPGDNLMIHVAVEVCQSGDILVVAPTSPCSNGYFGELLATSLAARGVRGLVIEAGCRDVKALKAMNFPVWSRGISSQGTVKASLGSVNIAMVCAGALVHPGDVIVSDDDGVVVVAREHADAVVKAAEKRAKKEDQTRRRLAAGELGLDIYDLRLKIADLGLQFE